MGDIKTYVGPGDTPAVDAESTGRARHQLYRDTRGWVGRISTWYGCRISCAEVSGVFHGRRGIEQAVLYLRLSCSAPPVTDKKDGYRHEYAEDRDYNEKLDESKAKITAVPSCISAHMAPL